MHLTNAAILEPKPFPELDRETWERTIGVNLSGAFYTISEALEALEESERAHVFNVAAQAAKRGFAGQVAYCASKYGLRGMGDALREDLRARGIRVSTVYPPSTATNLYEGLPGDWDRSKMIAPEEVAEAIWRAYNAPAGQQVDDVDIPARG